MQRGLSHRGCLCNQSLRAIAVLLHQMWAIQEMELGEGETGTRDRHETETDTQVYMHADTYTHAHFRSCPEDHLKEVSEDLEQQYLWSLDQKAN